MLKPPPPGSLLATDRSKAVVLMWFILNVFGVGVSCRNLCSFVVYLYVNGSGSITSAGEERAYSMPSIALCTSLLRFTDDDLISETVLLDVECF